MRTDVKMRAVNHLERNRAAFALRGSLRIAMAVYSKTCSTDLGNWHERGAPMRYAAATSILLAAGLLMSSSRAAEAQGEVGYFGPDQVARGQTGIHSVRASGLKLDAVQFIPSDDIQVSELTEIKPGEWSFKVTVGKAAVTGERTVTILGTSGQYKPVTVKVVDHAPVISDVKILAASPSWEVEAQLTVADERNDVDQQSSANLVLICSNGITSAGTELASVTSGARPNTSIAKVLWFGSGQRFSGTCEGVISIRDRAGNRSNDIKVPVSFK